MAGVFKAWVKPLKRNTPNCVELLLPFRVLIIMKIIMKIIIVVVVVVLLILIIIILLVVAIITNTTSTPTLFSPQGISASRRKQCIGFPGM